MHFGLVFLLDNSPLEHGEGTVTIQVAIQQITVEEAQESK